MTTIKGIRKITELRIAHGRDDVFVACKDILCILDIVEAAENEERAQASYDRAVATQTGIREADKVLEDAIREKRTALYSARASGLIEKPITKESSVE